MLPNKSIQNIALSRYTRALLADRRIRYVATGGVAAVAYYGLFSACWLAYGHVLPYLLIAVLANLVTAVVTFPLYRRGVFNSAVSWLRGFPRFYVSCLWSLTVSLVGLPLLIEVGRVPVLLAQALLLVGAPLINYQINRRWAFR